MAVAATARKMFGSNRSHGLPVKQRCEASVLLGIPSQSARHEQTWVGNYSTECGLESASLTAALCDRLFTTYPRYFKFVIQAGSIAAPIVIRQSPNLATLKLRAHN